MKITKFKIALAAGAVSSALLLNGCVAALVGGAAAGAGAVVGSDSRTVDIQMYDEQIEQDCKHILSDHRSDSDEKVFNVSVVAVNGNVLLAGQTKNQSYFNSCLEQIKHVEYVRHVYNYVENREPISSSAISNDAWITSKVKSQLLFGKNISSGRFKVFTEDKVVYLMGYVTRDEASRAVNQIKKNVSGIRKIVTIFDYMDSAQNPDPAVEQRKQASTVNRSSSMAAESQSTADNGGATIVGDDDELLAPAKPANW
ncbi:MAG: BON domain-containing protein [Succinatimonas sp.]|nr:BON domain-containing protein [Succinatimonas sp.]